MDMRHLNISDPVHSYEEIDGIRVESGNGPSVRRHLFDVSDDVNCYCQYSRREDAEGSCSGPIDVARMHFSRYPPAFREGADRSYLRYGVRLRDWEPL